MTHIIVKDGRVAVSGGRVVTSAGGAPCCCGGGGPGGDCDNGCGIRCDGPDCQILATSLDIACVTVDFGSIDSIQVCPDTNTLLESVVEIYAFPTRVDVPRVVGGTGFSVDFPILARTYTRRASTGVIITESIEVVTSATVTLDVKHCSTSSSSVACPMADDITVSSQFGALGLVFISNETLNFGNPHANEVTLGCGQNDNQTVLGSAVVQESVSCDSPATNFYARICGGSDQITVDITQRPPSDTRFNISYQGSIYVLTSEASDELPVAVTWTSAECDEWPLAQLCGGGSQITYDPATRPPDGATAIFFGSQYEPVAGFASSPPVPVTWSTDPCPGPSGPCAGLVPNDPLCAFPIYRDCPQCVGFDIGDPQPEPDFDVQDDGTIPGLGDMVAEAIRTISLNTILPCGACERRKQVLNRFGERAGRAVIRLLRW